MTLSTEMKPRGIFSVIKTNLGNGVFTFQVSGTKRDGERIRKRFPTEAEADAEVQRLAIENANVITSETPRMTWLSAEELQEAESAVKEMKKRGQPLSKAIRYFIDTYREPVKQITLQTAYDEFFKFKKETQGSRQRTLQNIASRVGKLAERYPALFVSALTLDQVAEHCARGGAQNQNNNRAELRGFFNWCMNPRRGYCTENLALKLDKVRGIDKDIAALTLAESRKLLEAARTYQPVARVKSPADNGGVVPFVALGLFGGLRPDEIKRLTWDNIDLEEKTIVVSSGKAKTRTRRVVEISDNLVDWLTPYKLKKRPIHWPRLTSHFERVRALAGFRPAEKMGIKVDPEKQHLKPWIQDYLRHSAISNHLAFHGNEQKTALWAGHNVDVIHGHYKSLVTKKEAAEFWSIAPGAKKIVKVKFSKAA